LPIVWLRPGYTEPDPNSGAGVFRTAAVLLIREHRPYSRSLSVSRQTSCSCGCPGPY
jgi:hypothetical protein